MASTVRDRLHRLRSTETVANESFAGMSLASLHPGNEWFDRCDFSRTDLRFATLDQCHFRFCSFSRANLTGASIRRATFAGCDLTDADLTNCDLTDSTFTVVNTGTPNGLTTLAGASMQNAILNGVKADRVVGWIHE